MIKKFTTITLASLILISTLSACKSSDQTEAEAVVLTMLKDPESALFSNFEFNAEKSRGCITVNSKNSFGAMSGPEKIAVTKTENGWTAYSYGSNADMYCAGVMSQT